MSQTRSASPALIAQVSEAAQAVLAGERSDEDIKLVRLSVGAHRQHYNDGYMLRIRIPGGRLSLAQWLQIADVAAAHASRGHLTLRQDIQLYHVGLPKVAAAAEALNRGGLSTYAAGGSTVRNITSGILGDQDPDALFDPYPYAAALSQRLSAHPLFNALPRKFKIGFAGPGPEAAQGWLNDLGFNPRIQDGARGFRVVAGGGLGANPQNAFEIAPFIKLQQVGPYAEAALEYFAVTSPKDKPLSNRFKFILREKGVEAVRAEIESRLAGKSADGTIVDESPAPGSVLWVEAPVGDLSPIQMQGLGRLLVDAGARSLRISFDQRLLVPGVNEAALQRLLAAIQALGLTASLQARSIRQVVCAGPDTCNRGLVNSKALGKALQDLDLPVSLHISGCQNGCSQHLTAPLSLQGLVRSGEGGRQPHYQLRVGRPLGEQGLSFTSPLLSLGARRVRAGLQRLLACWTEEASGLAFEAWLEHCGSAGLLQRLGELAGTQGEELRFDVGAEKPFEVALGGSECH